jgi:hypothetical protein
LGASKSWFYHYKRATVTITIAPNFLRFSLVSSAVDFLAKSRF